MTTETNEITMAEFIANTGLTMDAQPAPTNPHMSDMPEGSQHYYVTIAGRNGETLSTFYSVGPGIVERWLMKTRKYRVMGENTVPQSVAPRMRREKHGAKYRPELADILDCLVNDAITVENARNFADWAFDLGYSDDSIKADSIYRTVLEQAIALRRLVGAENYETLLYNIYTPA